jgi:hypothetical protein
VLTAVIAAVALALALVLSDRLTARLVTRRVARRVAQGLTGAAAAGPPPRITIAGVPFLTQFLAGRYRRVDITMAGFGMNGVEFSSLAATLSGVRAPLRALLAGDGLVAGRVTATVTLPLAVLTRRLPAGLSVRAKDGDLRISGTVLRLPVSGRLAVTAEPQRLCFTPLGVGRIPALVGFVLAVPGLPDRLAIKTVHVTPAGLVVSLTGTEVAVDRVSA